MQETKLADADAPVMPFRMLGYELVHHGEGRWNGVAILTRVGAEDVITNFGDGPVRDSSRARRRPPRKRTSTRSTRRGWSPPSAAASASSACTPRTAGSSTRRSTTASCAGSSAWPGGWLDDERPTDEPLLLGGDYNVTPAPEDVWSEAKAHGGTHVSPPERAALATLREWGLADTYRSVRPEPAASRGGTTGPACSTATRACASTCCTRPSRSRSASSGPRSTARRARARRRRPTTRRSSSTSTSPASRSTPAGRAPSSGSRHGRSPTLAGRAFAKVGDTARALAVTVRRPSAPGGPVFHKAGLRRRAPRSGRVTSGPMATAPARSPRSASTTSRSGSATCSPWTTSRSTSAAGEFFSLLGPSGCGKTTTLRMIGGFELPDGGRILLRDRDVTSEPPDKRVGEHGVPALRAVPAPDRRRQRRVRAQAQGHGEGRGPAPRRRRARARPRSTGYEKRKPNQLSGGQQQRVALARALANRPDVLLLDEPLGALDLKLRRQLQVELKRIQHEVGITFVYVTHDQEEALTMSDRIAVMNAGHVEQLGHARGALRAARRRGSSPTSSARPTCCARPSTPTRPRRASRRASAVAVDRDGHAPGASIEISIRPESIRLVPAAADGAVPARVEQAAYLGTTVSYLVRTTGGTGLTRPRPEDRDPPPGRQRRRRRLGCRRCPRARRGPRSEHPWRRSHDLIPTTARRSTSSARSSRYMAERRISRRYLLERIAILGAAAALAPSSPPARLEHRDAAAAPRRRRRGRARRRRRPRRASASARLTGPTPEPTPVPRPRASCSSTTGPSYMGKNVDPVVREEVQGQGHLRLLRQLRHHAGQDRPGRRRLRHHVPDLDRHPGPAQRAA